MGYCYYENNYWHQTKFAKIYTKLITNHYPKCIWNIQNIFSIKYKGERRQVTNIYCKWNDFQKNKEKTKKWNDFQNLLFLPLYLAGSDKWRGNKHISSLLHTWLHSFLE